MKLWGFTGGVGMGKSTVAQLIAARGVPTVDTDDLARKVVEPGQPALAEIQQIFGDELVGSDGQLRRDELARIVFSDANARRTLEAITHPRIRELWQKQAAAWRTQGKETGVVVIPLLFETESEEEFDTIVCVACSSATQHQRLLQRGWSPPQIQQRITSQWPIEKKMAAAQYVIWTEGEIEVATGQVDRILKMQ